MAVRKCVALLDDNLSVKGFVVGGKNYDDKRARFLWHSHTGEQEEIILYPKDNWNKGNRLRFIREEKIEILILSPLLWLPLYIDGPRRIHWLAEEMKESDSRQWINSKRAKLIQSRKNVNHCLVKCADADSSNRREVVTSGSVVAFTDGSKKLISRMRSKSSGQPQARNQPVFWVRHWQLEKCVSIYSVYHIFCICIPSF